MFRANLEKHVWMDLCMVQMKYIYIYISSYIYIYGTAPQISGQAILNNKFVMHYLF